MDKPIIADRRPTGVELEEGKDYYYCTCGRSSNQPFCDGSHAGTAFSPMAFTAKETGTAYLCQCKHTQNAPYCDGSHKPFTPEQVGQEGPGQDT
jgi:CDGSH-type Zn-finger protein